MNELLVEFKKTSPEGAQSHLTIHSGNSIYYNLMTTTKNENKSYGRSVKESKPHTNTDHQKR